VRSKNAYLGRTVENRGSNYSIDCAQGDILSLCLTVTANITVSLVNADPGTLVFLMLIQDGTGGHTVTLSSDFHWVGGSAPTLTTAANSVDSFSFMATSNKLKESSRALDVK